MDSQNCPRFLVTQEEWNPDNPAVYQMIIETLGEYVQILQTIQELAEYTVSLTRHLLAPYKGHDPDKIRDECIEENADAHLMLRQMAEVHGVTSINAVKRLKLNRLLEKLVKDGLILKQEEDE